MLQMTLLGKASVIFVFYTLLGTKPKPLHNVTRLHTNIAVNSYQGAINETLFIEY